VIRVIGPRDTTRPGEWVVDCTSRSKEWGFGLSPFYLGPVPLYEGAGATVSLNLENAWQYAKVYADFTDATGAPTEAYWTWARAGWAAKRAERYPHGRGTKPLYSLWAGERLDYVTARKRIYIPLYARAVVTTPAFGRLLARYRNTGAVTLWDYDGYDHRSFGMTLVEVVNHPERKMGHAFVLAHLLAQLAERQDALEKIDDAPLKTSG
jgi:hypothetical protein